jgi:hypothetical protein
MFTNLYVKYVRWGRMVEEGGKLYSTGTTLIQKAGRSWLDEQREVRLDGQK